MVYTYCFCLHTETAFIAREEHGPRVAYFGTKLNIFKEIPGIRGKLLNPRSSFFGQRPRQNAVKKQKGSDRPQANVFQTIITRPSVGEALEVVRM